MGSELEKTGKNKPALRNIKQMILTIRDVQVMLDRDLAEIYSVETKVLNQAVKRNLERFPEEFRFQLTQVEYDKMAVTNDQLNLRSQTVTSSGHGGRRYLPYVFTEQGVAMLCTVLRSKTAIEVSIQIINAFVDMRRFLQANAALFTRLESVERRQIAFESKTDGQFEKVFEALDASELPKQGVFYDGQVYDAHAFVSDLIRKAKKSLILIDNYADDTVLTVLSKRKKGVSAALYTRSISRALALDVQKHNQQYPPIEVKVFKQAHDRFLIIDDTVVYHFGASLKDLGKKWFAFSRFEAEAVEMLRKLKNEG